MRLLAPLWMILLVGCAQSLPPPDTPTTPQISAASSDLLGSGVSPADYASIGVTLAQQNCARWFTTQTMNAQATGFGTQGLAVLGGVAAAAGGPAGAGAAAGMAALSGLLGAAQSSFGAGANPAMIWGLISRVQAAWLAAMPTPLTVADAYALVESFAEQCSLPAIQRSVMEAMSSVPVGVALPAVASPAYAPANLVSPQNISGTKQSARSRAAQQVPNHSMSSTPPPCYMTVMGCSSRVATPRVVIGSHSP